MSDERFEPGRQPFPGLRPFLPEEAHLFFGRDQQRSELLGRLRKTRFLAVVGTSGSGKSSLVRAGLLPGLYGGFMAGGGTRWRIVDSRPGGAPIRRLAAALDAPGALRDGELAEDEFSFTEVTLRHSSNGLVQVVREQRLAPGERVLVLVDQFEEVFRYLDTERSAAAFDEASAFVKLLLAAVHQDETPIYVVLTMRSDFLGDCSRFRGLPEEINDGQYLVPRLSRDQLREAITGPAAVFGKRMDHTLVNRLLNDLGDDPDQLPVLQHALMRTWDRCQREQPDAIFLSLEDYELTGGMGQALSKHADDILDELTANEPTERATARRAVAKRLFQALTEVDESGRQVRRLARLRDVAAAANVSTEEVVRVVEAFRRPGNSFLMPPAGDPLEPDTYLDISHESLIRKWRTLGGWLLEESESATTYKRLSQTAGLQAQGREELLSGQGLRVALDWRAREKPTAAWARRYNDSFATVMSFLDASEKESVIQTSDRWRLRRLRATGAVAGFFLIAIPVLYFSRGYLIENVEARRDLRLQREAFAKADAELRTIYEIWPQDGTLSPDGRDADLEARVASLREAGSYAHALIATGLREALDRGPPYELRAEDEALAAMYRSLESEASGGLLSGLQARAALPVESAWHQLGQALLLAADDLRYATAFDELRDPRARSLHEVLESWSQLAVGLANASRIGERVGDEGVTRAARLRGRPATMQEAVSQAWKVFQDQAEVRKRHLSQIRAQSAVHAEQPWRRAPDAMSVAASYERVAREIEEREAALLAVAVEARRPFSASLLTAQAVLREALSLQWREIDDQRVTTARQKGEVLLDPTVGPPTPDSELRSHVALLVRDATNRARLALDLRQLLEERARTAGGDVFEEEPWWTFQHPAWRFGGLGFLLLAAWVLVSLRMGWATVPAALKGTSQRMVAAVADLAVAGLAALAVAATAGLLATLSIGVLTGDFGRRGVESAANSLGWIVFWATGFGVSIGYLLLRDAVPYRYRRSIGKALTGLLAIRRPRLAMNLRTSVLRNAPYVLWLVILAYAIEVELGWLRLPPLSIEWLGVAALGVSAALFWLARKLRLATTDRPRQLSASGWEQAIGVLTDGLLALLGVVAALTSPITLMVFALIYLPAELVLHAVGDGRGLGDRIAGTSVTRLGEEGQRPRRLPRTLASLVELVTLPPLVALSMMAGFLVPDGMERLGYILFWASPTLGVAYLIARDRLPIRGRRRSPGKALAGLEIVRSDGRAIDLWTSLRRNCALVLMMPMLLYAAFYLIDSPLGPLVPATLTMWGAVAIAGALVVIRRRRLRSLEKESVPALATVLLDGVTVAALVVGYWQILEVFLGLEADSFGAPLLQALVILGVVELWLSTTGRRLGFGDRLAGTRVLELANTHEDLRFALRTR